MAKNTADSSKSELPIEALILECKKDRYKLSYAALRWAKEIKQKENLPEAIPFLIPRAVREILTGKVSIKEIEKLPMLARVAQPPAAPAQPTLTLNVAADETESKGKDKEKSKED